MVDHLGSCELFEFIDVELAVQRVAVDGHIVLAERLAHEATLGLRQEDHDQQEDNQRLDQGHELDPFSAPDVELQVFEDDYAWVFGFVDLARAAKDVDRGMLVQVAGCLFFFKGDKCRYWCSQNLVFFLN